MTDEQRLRRAAEDALSEANCSADVPSRAAMLVPYLAVVEDAVVVVGGQLHAGGNRWTIAPDVGPPRTATDVCGGSGRTDLPFPLSALIADLRTGLRGFEWDPRRLSPR